jgi:hypothetical protein
MDATKIAPRLVTPNLCFCIRWDLRVTLCILVHPDSELLTLYFLCLGGTSTDSTKITLEHVTLNMCFCI